LKKKLKAFGFLFVFVIFFLHILFLSHLTWASEEYTRTAKAETTGEINEFKLIIPGNLGGTINLQVGEEEVCRVDLECWSRARNRKMAKEFTELVEMNLEKVNQLVTLRLITPQRAPWEGTNYSIQTKLDIYVPPDITVDLRTKNFLLDVSGPLEKAFIDNSYGTVRVEDVSQETNIIGDYNQVAVEDVEGDLEIETSYKSIYVRRVDTRGNKAFFKTTYGKIELIDFTGQLEANTSFSPIDASAITLTGGRNEFKTVHSQIDLEFEEIEDCELYVYNSYGNVRLLTPPELSARFTLTVGRGGRIHTTGIPIRPLVIEKTRLEGISGDGDSEIEVDIEGIGKILVE
jgi:hypothetical protein